MELHVLYTIVNSSMIKFRLFNLTSIYCQLMIECMAAWMKYGWLSPSNTCTEALPTKLLVTISWNYKLSDIATFGDHWIISSCHVDNVIKTDTKCDGVLWLDIFTCTITLLCSGADNRLAILNSLPHKLLITMELQILYIRLILL